MLTYVIVGLHNQRKENKASQEMDRKDVIKTVDYVGTRFCTS